MRKIKIQLSIIQIFMLVSVACMAYFVVSAENENRRLKNTISELYLANEQQIKLLNDKSSEIKDLKSQKSSFDEAVKEYANKYREIADRYVSGLLTGSSSRSGSRDIASFSADYKELKDILKSLREISSFDNSFIDLSDAESRLQTYLDSIPTLWPVSGRVSENFGYRSDPFTKKRTMHEGLDIAAPKGRDIKASASGKVSYAGAKSGYGNVIIVDHCNGIKTLYAHASKLIAKEGQTVKRGEIIAKVGNTGRSTGPHLHFEVLFGGIPVNPMDFLE